MPEKKVRVQVEIPAYLRDAVKAWAGKRYKIPYAMELLLKDTPELKPFIKKEESHAIA